MDKGNVVEFVRDEDVEEYNPTHRFNTELNDQQHQKIKAEIKKEKEDFIKQQVSFIVVLSATLNNCQLSSVEEYSQAF